MVDEALALNPLRGGILEDGYNDSESTIARRKLVAVAVLLNGVVGPWLMREVVLMDYGGISRSPSAELGSIRKGVGMR